MSHQPPPEGLGAVHEHFGMASPEATNRYRRPSHHQHSRRASPGVHICMQDIAGQYMDATLCWRDLLSNKQPADQQYNATVDVSHGKRPAGRPDIARVGHMSDSGLRLQAWQAHQQGMRRRPTADRKPTCCRLLVEVVEAALSCTAEGPCISPPIIMHSR